MIVSEYRKGRERKFFLREHEGTYFLEKITKSCGFTVKAGTEVEIMDYISDNGYKFVGLIAK